MEQPQGEGPALLGLLGDQRHQHGMLARFSSQSPSFFESFIHPVWHQRQKQDSGQEEIYRTRRHVPLPGRAISKILPAEVNRESQGVSAVGIPDPARAQERPGPQPAEKLDAWVTAKKPNHTGSGTSLETVTS